MTFLLLTLRSQRLWIVVREWSTNWMSREEAHVDENVSTIIFDSTSSDWFYTTGEDVTEDQDPVEEEPDPVEGPN
jgi:hypothetical protein